MVVAATVPGAVPVTSDCGVYLAPSTIPGAGMGMFAGKNGFKKGKFVAGGDIVIPSVEMKWNNGHKPFDFLWTEYQWAASMFPGMEQEAPGRDLDGCSEGIGAAINCFMPLVNIKEHYSSMTMSMSGVSTESPGAGAFTVYHNRRFYSKKDIKPGFELYVSYGEKYFKSRQAYKAIPMSENYKKADKLLSQYKDISSRLLSTIGGDSDGFSTRMDLWNLIKDHPLLSERTHNAFPDNETQVEAVMESGGTSMMHYNNSAHSIEWLEEYGQCMDNIEDDVSTIPHAGRGAFASRFIRKGGLVSPAPLIHIPDRNVLTMYKPFELENGKLRRNASEPVHQQLMLNYCFGHPESTLLLCPYGLQNGLINHSTKPNTKIQWAEHMQKPEWKDMPVREWGWRNHNGLSFDYVALRDIEVGDEILIDYGDEWEEAWQQHVREFDRPRRNYRPAFELNREVDLRIRTMYEESYSHHGVRVYCRQTYLKLDGLQLEKRVKFKDEKEEGLELCRVRERLNDDSYVAEIYEEKFRNSTNGEKYFSDDIVKKVLFNVPRDAFYFIDDHYSRDMHQPWSFRHHMRIPDEMFPEVWKNAVINVTTTTTTTNTSTEPNEYVCTSNSTHPFQCNALDS